MTVRIHLCEACSRFDCDVISFLFLTLFSVTGLNIPTGVPLVYDLDENMKPIRHPDAIAPLQGRYLGNQEEVRARIGAVLAQTK